MPELPEVESIRRTLMPALLGQKISKVEIFNPNSWKGSAADVLGSTVTGSLRRGKILNICLSNNKYLAIHLKMSGQLFYVPLIAKKNIPSLVKHLRVIIHLEDNCALYFYDIRKFGWIKIGNNLEGTIAPDVSSTDFQLEYLEHIVSRSTLPVHQLLLDQNRLAGIGNIYANDALFLAKIKPDRKANSLKASETARLYQAIVTVITKGIEKKGSSATAVYRLPDGSSGDYQNHFLVYKQEDKHCQNCQTKIVREKLRGRSVFYCPSCQI